MKIRMRKRIGMLIMLAICAAYISEHYIQLMLVQGASMYPAYHHMQLVALNKRDRQFQTGDVVAFTCDALDALLVKRIAAEPGDTVWIREGILFVNGKPYNQSTEAVTYAGIAANAFAVPEGSYFMMGDNSKESKDSRYEKIGCVSAGSIIGKVIP